MLAGSGGKGLPRERPESGRPADTVPVVAARGAARIAGILWLVATFAVAVVRTAQTTQREIGSGVEASCHPTWTSQLPQLLVAFGGCALLLVAAERHLLRMRVVLAAACLACIWLVVLALAPPAFDLVCSN
jgi:hypothetical protein